ncbi:hypothetical protein GTQ40_08160 [Flavobacteriaceae bacterium R38]|nr:hypothetical protein [Flavobacteriaceae bacterium R38]
MKQTIETLKTYFETGDKPTQQQFEALLDSFIHIDSFPKPEFLEIENGYVFNYIIPQDDNGVYFTYDQPIGFWNYLGSLYVGMKPLKKLIISNLTTAAPGMSVLYNGNPVLSGTEIVFEEKSLALADEFRITDELGTGFLPGTGFLDNLLTVNIDPNVFNGQEDLFSFQVVVEDFLGKTSVPIILQITNIDSESSGLIVQV